MQGFFICLKLRKKLLVANKGKINGQIDARSAGGSQNARKWPVFAYFQQYTKRPTRVCESMSELEAFSKGCKSIQNYFFNALWRILEAFITTRPA